MMDTINLLHSDISMLEFYQQLFQQLRGVIVLKDMDCRFVLANQYTANMFGFKDTEAIKGKTDFDLLCPAAECAPEFNSQDRHVSQSSAELTLLEVLTFADDEQKVFLTKKKPFMAGGKVVGSICHCNEMNLASLSRISSLLMQSDARYHTHGKKGRTYTVGTVVGGSDLTPREHDCLFYMLRGRTMNETATILGIGWRSVEDYINNIKYKWNCANKKEIIELAIASGYLDYIPQTIVVDNTTYVLHEDGEAA